MSEEVPKSRRILFLASMVAGGICLLLVGGYPIGKVAYGTWEGTKRPGFKLWTKVYKRMLFMKANKNGWRYSDLGRDTWITAEFVRVHSPVFSGGSGYYVQFMTSDGRMVHTGSKYEIPSGLELRRDELYRLKMRPVLEYEYNPFEEDPVLEWYVDMRATEVREITPE